MNTVQTFNSINPALDYFHDNASSVSKAWKENLEYKINNTALGVFIWSCLTSGASVALAFTATILVYNRVRLLFSIPIILATGITIILAINLIRTSKSLSAAKEIFKEGISVDDVKKKIKELKASHTTVFLNYFNVLNGGRLCNLQNLISSSIIYSDKPSLFTRIYNNPTYQTLWEEMISTSNIFYGRVDGSKLDSLIMLANCLNAAKPIDQRRVVQKLEIKNSKPEVLPTLFEAIMTDAYQWLEANSTSVQQ